MPEGDTIARSAAVLAAVLEGRPVVRFEAPRLAGPLPEPGATVRAVEARGKHLLVHFDPPPRALTLRTHLGMHGAWHVYRPGERWQRPAATARVVMEVDGAVAVCFRPPVVEVVPSERLRFHLPLTRLGPDLARSDPDLDESLRRLAALDPATPVADALLDQRVAAGIGNVYKSEVLFACGTDPFAPLATVRADERRRLLETAWRQLRANLGSGPRRTVPGGLAVYGRAGRPCRRCGTPIAARRLGRDARVTYWCPSCQPSRDGTTPAGQPDAADEDDRPAHAGDHPRRR